MMGQSDSSTKASSQQVAPAASASSPPGGKSSAIGGDTWISQTEARICAVALPPAAPLFPAARMASCGCAPPAVPQLPVGMDFYKAVQAEWRARPKDGRAPIPVAAPQMDPEDIIDAIAETPGDVLSPPVHLPFMIECLLEVWDEEGLYD